MIKNTKSLTGFPSDLSLPRPGILLVLPALFVITTSRAQAQTTSGRAADSAYISQGESDWAESMAKHNATAVGRILADDFIEIGVTGTRYTKTDAGQLPAIRCCFQPCRLARDSILWRCSHCIWE